MNAKERLKSLEKIEGRILSARDCVASPTLSMAKLYLAYALNHVAELKAVLYQDAIDAVRAGRTEKVGA